ncbi:MAG: transposase [Alcaligenaceae bacterium]|nr:transposase [Alcaligenaceae bacterium]
MIIRGDSGFCRQPLIRWCERRGVQYLIGLARNKRLQARVEQAEEILKSDYARTGRKQRKHPPNTH